MIIEAAMAVHAMADPAVFEIPAPFADLIACESGGNPDAVSPAGHLARLQWVESTWTAVKPETAPADPRQATVRQEIAAALTLLEQPWGGLHHWPFCSRAIGVR